MKQRSLFRKALFYISGPRCIGCDIPLDIGDQAFCPECSFNFKEKLTRNCSLCARPLLECDCAHPFLSEHFVKRLYKCLRYNGKDEDNLSAALIYSLKTRPRWDIYDFAFDLLERSLRNSKEDFSSWIFTNVPRRRSAKVKYGVDQSQRIAKAMAKRFGAKYISFLSSKSKKEQKRLTREERLENADFVLKRNGASSVDKVLIFDDIVTTGASMGKAAALIRSLGIKEIRGAALAIAYPDQIKK